MTSRDILATALKDVETDDYGWPVDDQCFDKYLRQFEETSRECQTELVGHGQKLLFDVDSYVSSHPTQTLEADSDSLIRSAFLDMNEGASTDLVVADPARNFQFVQACWRRGLQGSQAELNHRLLNARKAKKIGRIEGVIRYRVSREIMEAYEFASEVGVRLLQDRTFSKEARWVSLDDILCDPSLGKQFLNIAESITPGFRELDYRWAALSIRKAMNRKVAKRNELKYPDFYSLGSANSIDFCSIPEHAGFFWLRSGAVDFYIGHASNLRSKVQSMVNVDLDSRIEFQNSPLLFDNEPLEYLIASTPTMKIAHRFEVKRLAVANASPRFNITKEMDRKIA